MKFNPLEEALKRKKEEMGKVHIDILVDGVHNGEEENEKENEEMDKAPETLKSMGEPRLEDDMHEKAEMAGLPVAEDEDEVGEALLAGEREVPGKGISGLRDRVKAGIRKSRK